MLRVARHNQCRVLQLVKRRDTMHEIRFRGRPIEQLNDTELRAALKEVLGAVWALERALVERGTIREGELVQRLEETTTAQPLRRPIRPTFK